MSSERVDGADVAAGEGGAEAEEVAESSSDATVWAPSSSADDADDRGDGDADGAANCICGETKRSTSSGGDEAGESKACAASGGVDDEDASPGEAASAEGGAEDEEVAKSSCDDAVCASSSSACGEAECVAEGAAEGEAASAALISAR